MRVAGNLAVPIPKHPARFEAVPPLGLRFFTADPALAAIVDIDQRTLAFKAVAAAFHTGIIAIGRRLRLSYPF